MNRKDEFIVVRRAANEMEAQVLKSLMESYGIPCFLKPNVALPRPYSPVLNIGEIEVMVPASLGEKAKKLIQGDADV